MTDAELAEIEKRANAATEGPWDHGKGHGQGATVWLRDYVSEHGARCPSMAVCRGVFRPGDGPWSDEEADGENNAEFIANARHDVPALVAEVRKLKALLRKNEWVEAGTVGPGDYCLQCGNGSERGHEADCELAEAIK